MHRFFCFIGFFLFSVAVFGQKAESIPDDFDGTYQFQVIKSRGYPFIPADLDEIIRKNRKEKEIVYVELGSLVILKILPVSEIVKPAFIPMERIVYLTEKEDATR